jgi:hypothetical protein
MQTSLYFLVLDSNKSLPSVRPQSFRSDAPGPVDEILEKSDDPLPRRRVCQISFLIKPVHGVADQHLGLVDGEHVEIHENLPEMILRTRNADGSCGCTHDRGRFAIPGVVAVGTLSPINCILQYTLNCIPE